jgi:hypothetical protein
MRTKFWFSAARPIYCAVLSGENVFVRVKASDWASFAESWLNFRQSFVRCETMARQTPTDSTNGIDLVFSRIDDFALRLAGWAGHKIDAPNNSAPVKKRTRKNLPRKIKTIPPFRGVFFG